MAVKEKLMVTIRRCRRKREFPKNRREKYVFILRKYLPLGIDLDILVSTNKQMVLARAQTLLQKLPEEIWRLNRSMPFHQGRSDEELRQFLKDDPDSTYYGIVIYDNNTGEVVNSVVVTDKIDLPAY